MYIKEIKIKKILPCLTDQTRIRFYAELDNEIAELLPYLNRIIKNAIYNPTIQTLSIKITDSIVTLYPNREIAAGYVKDTQTLQMICDWLKQKINYVYENKDKIEPLFEQKNKLGVLEVYRLLPQTNCKKCGELTCLSFAAKVVSEEKNILSCSEIFYEDYSQKRKELFKLLRSCGYLVPKNFV